MSCKESKSFTLKLFEKKKDKNQVARQDPSNGGPEEGKGAKYASYSLKASTAKMDWPYCKSA